ncbi:MAG: DNA polymerase III subunit beta [Candidatus Aminicenantia bacterium]
MNFLTKKENILTELQLLQGIVEKRNTMPILANILLRTKEKEVELIGTDLEVGMKTAFEAEITKEGGITLSGKKLFEIVKSLPEDAEIKFEEVEESIIRIKCGSSEFKISGLSVDDYPKIPVPKFERKINLPLELIQQMIDKVYFAITQEHRYYLNGALMILKDKSIELVSTDGHRLAYTIKQDIDLNLDQEIQVIISKKTLYELSKIDDQQIEFDFDENNLFFKIGKRTLISRIIEGKFPDYKTVIPQNNENILTLSRGDLIDSIRRVALLSSERSRGIKFFIKGNEIELYSSNPEIGEARDILNVNFSGKNLEIGFNSQYILDFLNVVKVQNVRFELKDENSATLLRPSESEEVEFLYVLMPMKI